MRCRPLSSPRCRPCRSPRTDDILPPMATKKSQSRRRTRTVKAYLLPSEAEEIRTAGDAAAFLEEDFEASAVARVNLLRTARALVRRAVAAGWVPR